MDLSPFAGVLCNGQPHTVAVSVYNANQRFDVASNLLLYTDPSGTAVTGGLTVNTLSNSPMPDVQHYLNTAADGTVSGPVYVTDQRNWTISGYVITAAGRTDTSIQAYNSFTNSQDEKVSSLIFKQNLSQETDQQEVTTVTSATGTTQTQHDISYPLIVDYNQAPDDNNDGGLFVANYVKQIKVEQLRTPYGANSPNPVVSSETVETSDTLHYGAAGNFVGHDGNHATSQYGAKDAQGRCIYRGLTANNLILTGVDDSTSCSLAP